MEQSIFMVHDLEARESGNISERLYQGSVTCSTVLEYGETSVDECMVLAC